MVAISVSSILFSLLADLQPCQVNISDLNSKKFYFGAFFLHVSAQRNGETTLRKHKFCCPGKGPISATQFTHKEEDRLSICIIKDTKKNPNELDFQQLPVCSPCHRHLQAAVTGSDFLQSLQCQIELLAAHTRRASPTKQLFQSLSTFFLFLHKRAYSFFKAIWLFPVWLLPVLCQHRHCLLSRPS